MGSSENWSQQLDTGEKAVGRKQIDQVDKLTLQKTAEKIRKDEEQTAEPTVQEAAEKVRAAEGDLTEEEYQSVYNHYRLQILGINMAHGSGDVDRYFWVHGPGRDLHDWSMNKTRVSVGTPGDTSPELKKFLPTDFQRLTIELIKLCRTLGPQGNRSPQERVAHVEEKRVTALEAAKRALRRLMYGQDNFDE